jgi:hypothetical protein
MSIPKFDYLLEHSRRRKSIFVVMLGVKTREISENKKCAHVKHQVLFVQIPINFVFYLVISQGLDSKKRKFVQFTVIM